MNPGQRVLMLVFFAAAIAIAVSTVAVRAGEDPQKDYWDGRSGECGNLSQVNVPCTVYSKGPDSNFDYIAICLPDGSELEMVVRQHKRTSARTIVWKRASNDPQPCRR